MSEEKFLTVREASLILGATEKDVLDLAEKGTLPAYRIGGVYLRFKKEQILEYKKTHDSIFPHAAHTHNASLRDKIMDFLYLNDFYILAFSVIAALLVFIFRGD